MLVSEINSLLTNFVKAENNIQTILINGVYGCGKTYNVNNFFKKYNHDKNNVKKLNYIYLSVFGAKSIY